MNLKEMQGGRMMPTTSVVRMVAAIAVACLVLAATARGNVEVGDVGEYWQKRTQEARVRKHGAPLNDLVAAATRFHQDLLHRYVLSTRNILLPLPPPSLFHDII